MTGIEALMDAIMHQEGWFPGSVSNRNRNPGNLRGSSVIHTTDVNGYCRFETLFDGLAALKLDLTAKITGKGGHKLGPNSALDDFFNVYAPASDHNQPSVYAGAVANWCTIALARTVTHLTSLKALCPELFASSPA